MHRRERALRPAADAFVAAVPERIRGDERFQQALQDADTAESLQRAMTLHEEETKEWAAKGFALLRAVEAADDAYEQELVQALDAYRNSTTEGGEENGTSGLHSH